MLPDGIETFGEVLNTYRKQKRMSQRQLAQQLSVHINTISAWECGAYLPKTKGMVVEIAAQLGLDQQATLHLLQASLTVVSSYWYVPHQRPPFFIGREMILQHLHEVLGPENHTHQNRVYALTGLGGVGKTQTALEYAYRYAHDYTAIFWIDAQTRESLHTSFSALADLLRLPERHSPDHHHLIAAVHHWLNRHRQWLIIFDNVEDIVLMRTMMPTSWSGAVLLTTQRQSTGAYAQMIHLNPMNAEESFQFLLHRSRLLNVHTSLGASHLSFSRHDEQAARDIVTLMDGLPLALDQAGAYIEATQCSIAEFLRLLQSSRLHLLKERAAEADHPISVLKTFEIAFDKVQASNAFASDLLIVCAFLALDTIPEALLIEHACLLGVSFQEAASDPLQFNAAIKELLTYSLIQRHAQTLTLHRLVQTAIINRVAPDIQQVWVKRLLRVLNHAFPSESEQMEYWLWCEQCIPHVTKVLLHCESVADALEASTLLYKTATYLYHRTRYQEAELAYQRALALREQVPGTNHQDIAELLIGLAESSFSQGKFTSAKVYSERAITLLECTQGSNDITLLEPLNTLAFLHIMQGQFAVAEELLQRVLSIWVRTILHDLLDPDPSSYGVSIHGAVGQDTHTLVQQALSLWEQVPHRHHCSMGYTLTILSRVYQQQQRYQEAEAILLLLHRIGKQTLGEKHPLITRPLVTLAEIYKEQGKLVEAEQCYHQALTILEQSLETVYPETKEIRSAHAQLLSEIRKAEQQKINKRHSIASVETRDKQIVGNDTDMCGESCSVLPVCPGCRCNTAVIKSGTNRSGTSRFRCRSCQRYFTPQSGKQGYDLSFKRHALTLVEQGKSYRAIARTLGVDHRTIGIWVKECKFDH